MAAITVSAPKGNAKRDTLCAAEVRVQAIWESAKAFECNPDDSSREKFLTTFPYPYSNGHLHIGHAFSLSKAVLRLAVSGRDKHSLQRKTIDMPHCFRWKKGAT